MMPNPYRAHTVNNRTAVVGNALDNHAGAWLRVSREFLLNLEALERATSPTRRRLLARRAINSFLALRPEAQEAFQAELFLQMQKYTEWGAWLDKNIKRAMIMHPNKEMRIGFLKALSNQG